MATSNELNLLTVKELASIAKELGVVGWHEMRKDELVRALIGKSRTKSVAVRLKVLLSSVVKTTKKPSAAPKEIQKKTPTESSVTEKLSPNKEKKKSVGVPVSKNQAVLPVAKAAAAQTGAANDMNLPTTSRGPSRLGLIVRDPYWLQAYWEVDAKAVERAKVAMGPFWHTATPVLRLYQLDSDGSSNPRRRFLRDINIHGGVNNWYIDVKNPPSTFLLELGFLSREKKFFPIVSSNNVTTPQRQLHDDVDRLDGNWKGIAADLDWIFKQSGGLEGYNSDLKDIFEEKLQRPMSGPMLSRFRASQQGNVGEKTRRHFDFQIDAQIVIRGKTDPSVQVSIRGVPIPVAADGDFSIRFPLPEKRHVFPIDAEGSDGVETQRVILAIERNTKILETLFLEPEEED